MSDVDLFGKALEVGQACCKTPQGFKRPAMIGTGPAGETCKTCAHLSGHRMARTFYKCGLMRRYWTGGPGTDIKLRDAACSKHERVAA